MKLLDVLFIRKYYRTREDLLRDGVPSTTEEMKQDIASRPNILEPLLQSDFVERMANLGRVVVENNVKLRDFREEVFGKYTENIPYVDTSRYPSVPLPTSSAHPADESSFDNGAKWTYISGQKVFGNMIPQVRK
mmetsp:Transcript_2597/g.4194  ORF Transcript_2597/g.4194 Transcript_2597/m.4194 type:complete len:134 (-) Transcript_2597:15-416(-)